MGRGLEAMVVLGAVVAMASAAGAQEPRAAAKQPALVIELAFDGDGVRVAGVTRTELELAAPRRRPAGLEFEVEAPDGRLLLTGPLHDPRELRTHSIDPQTGQARCRVHRLDSGSTVLVIPDDGGDRTLRVIDPQVEAGGAEREVATSKARRNALLEMRLPAGAGAR